MKKALILLLILTGMIILNFTGFTADNPLATSISSLAKQLTNQFGVIEIKVAAVQGDQVYLNAGKKQFVRLNTVYEIIQEGDPVYQPNTKIQIGKLETHVADVKITAVRDNLAIAQVINKTEVNVTTLAIGQKAVEKSPKFSIAVIPFNYLNSKDIVTPRVAQELMINELIKTGRFVVADSLRTEQVAKQVSSTSAPGSVQFTKEAAKLLGVDYVMYGCLTDLPGFMDIQCRIHEASSGAGIAAGNVQIVAPTPIQPTPTK